MKLYFMKWFQTLIKWLLHILESDFPCGDVETDYIIFLPIRKIIVELTNEKSKLNNLKDLGIVFEVFLYY